MDKELKRVYEIIQYRSELALKGGNAYKADILDDIIGLIEDADEHFSCLNCKHWDDDKGCRKMLEPFVYCSRGCEDLWERGEEADD
jgi:hypothetical protein